jgi:site-specific DNA recombinase
MKSDTPVHVVGYRRVSTEEQATDGFSMRDQESKIRGYCALYGLNLLEIIDDPGVSGKSLERPGIRRALTMLRNKEAAGLVIAKLDRLSRSLRDWSDLVDEFFAERKGCHLFSVMDSIDTTSASGRLVLNMLMAVAQWEREIIGERTRDGLRIKLQNDEWCGRPRFGFDIAEDGKHVVPNEREQAAIARMREWKAAGLTLRAMKAELETLGIQTKEGRVWTPTTISRIIERRD